MTQLGNFLGGMGQGFPAGMFSLQQQNAQDYTRDLEMQQACFNARLLGQSSFQKAKDAIEEPKPTQDIRTRRRTQYGMQRYT